MSNLKNPNTALQPRNSQSALGMEGDFLASLAPFSEQKDTATQNTHRVIPATGQGEGVKSFTVGGGTSHSF